MRRRRRARAPYYKVPSPHDLISGKRKRLQRDRSFPYSMVFRIQSISDDYLTCEGWNPVSHTYLYDIIVALPFSLRVNPVGVIRYVGYTDTPTKVSLGLRTVLRSGETVSRTETIEPTYFVGDLIVGVRMEGIIGEEVLKPVLYGGNWSTSAEVNLPDDMPMDGMTEDDKPVFWMDANVAGRQWLSGASATGIERHFAKVYAGWTNTKGEHLAGSWIIESVNVRSCSWDGGNVGTSVFPVWTIIHKNKDTALFTDYIVEWAEVAGDKVIVSDIWDDPFGIVKWESVDTANIRDGWRLCDGASGAPDLRGGFIMHRDTVDSALNDDSLPANSENAIGKTGGKRYKESAYAYDSLGGLSAQDTSPEPDPPGTWPAPVTDSNGDTMAADIKESISPDVVPPANDDIRPRFYAMAAIQRYA